MLCLREESFFRVEGRGGFLLRLTGFRYIGARLAAGTSPCPTSLDRRTLDSLKDHQNARLHLHNEHHPHIPISERVTGKSISFLCYRQGAT